MSLPTINPEGLPVLPTWARRAVYAVYVLAWAGISSTDAYYEEGDPFWVEGAWRVLINLSVFVGAFALLNARPTVTEQVKDRVEAIVEQKADAAGRANGGPFG